MLFNSVTVRLSGMDEKNFLSPLYDYFVEGLATIIPCSKENIFIFSIEDDSESMGRILKVSFSAKRPDLPGEVFFTQQYLKERVYLQRHILVKLTTLQVNLYLSNQLNKNLNKKTNRYYRSTTPSAFVSLV